MKNIGCETAVLGEQLRCLAVTIDPEVLPDP